MQSLERRQLLAAGLGCAVLDDPGVDAQAALVSATQSEGEPEPDLVAFAKLVAAAEVKYFAAAWHPDSTAQVQLFGDGADDLPFIEVTGPDREFNDIAAAEEVDSLPTWEFQDGSRYEGMLTLEEISSMSGIDIPVGEAPSFETIPDQTVLIGSPLHIPIDAYDPNGDPLTVTVSVDDPEEVEAVVISGNRSIRIDMDGFGDMVFELFEQRAPLPAGRVAELAESGFYDGIVFHRIIDNFMIQGGDPTGTGTSGSELGVFDDQFHPDLQHNRSGILSFAKSTDDTNNSQFFITEVPTRSLDYNHSIFGQIVEGEQVREAISEMETYGPEVDAPDPSDDDPFPVDPDPDHMKDQPVIDIMMTTIDVFTDNENAVIMLKAKSDQPVTTTVTVTVTDSNQMSSQQSFDVSVVPESDNPSSDANSHPYLGELDIPSELFVGQTIEIQLDSIDVEGDDVQYLAGFAGQTITEDIDQETGLVSITAPAETGSVFFVAVVAAPTASGSDFDRQVFVIDVVEVPPFHRPENPPDVDGLDGATALDALLIINAMFVNGGEIDLSGGEVEGLDPTFKYNVSGDLKISALDALQVINALAAGESQQNDSRADLKTVHADSVFSGDRVVLPMFADHDDDNQDDLISILAEYQLGLQTLA